MTKEREAAIRLLKAMMVASIAVPAILFIVAAWFSYHDLERVIGKRLERSLKIVHEHSFRVLQTVELALSAVNEFTRGMSDEDIRADENAINQQLNRIVGIAPEMLGILILDEHGHPLVFSSRVPVSKTLDMSDRDYFSAIKRGARGPIISVVEMPRLGGPRKLVVLVHARRAVAGRFNGAVSVGVLASYFENVYADLATEGSFFTLMRSDGYIVARYPPMPRPIRLPENAEIRRRIARGLDRSVYWATSPVDNVDYKTAYRKLGDYPLYVVTGTAWKALFSDWARYNISYLIFGVALTAFLFFGLALALRRTQRLYDEADRREAAEAALSQAQRLETIGQLTGGVAHDFNNLLMAVNGSVQLLRQDITDKRGRRLLDTISNAVKGGESLTRQLLSYARRQTLAPEAVDLSTRLPALHELLTSALRSDIDIKVDVPREPCVVRVDAGEFEVAILNLAVNARDAMPKGGSLSIGVKPMHLNGGETTERLSGDFIAVSVVDTGCGIPEELMPRIFEPFFTTKEIDKGTGLGLSQVYGFARQSGGTATVSSEKDRGTTLTLYLPRSHETPHVAPSIAPPPVAEAAGTILLVEDNSEIAEVTAEYLRQLGYRVRSVASVRAALAALRLDPAVDLVFSDIVMPGGLNGLDLVDEIRQRYSEIPVLLATGYSASAQTAVARGVVVLQKPYDLEALRRHIQEAMVSTNDRGRPAAQSSQPNHRTATASVPDSDEKRVLLAELVSPDRDRLAEQLRDAGLDVALAASGAEAMAMAARAAYDLILIGRDVPEMDGLEATQAIRLLPDYADIPIVGLVGSVSSADRAACLAAGMTDYLDKTSMPDTLNSLVSQWLHHGPLVGGRS